MDTTIYQYIVNQSPVGCAYLRMVADESGNPCDFEFLDVNPAFEALIGLQKEPVRGTRLSESLPEIGRDGFDWVRALGEVALFRKSVQIEQYSETLGKWLRVKAYSPEKLYAVLHVQDFSNEAEKAFNLDEFFKINPDLVSIALPDGHFIEVNSEWERLLGYTREELLTLNYYDLIHPDDVSRTEEATAMLVQRRQLSDFVNRFRGKDGDYRSLEWHLRTRNGLIFAAARDITQKLEEERRQQLLIYASERMMWGTDHCASYSEIVEVMQQITKARYIFFNLYDREGDTLKTVAVAGEEEQIQKAEKLLGKKILGGLWKAGAFRRDGRKGAPFTVYADFSSFIGKGLPEAVSHKLLQEFPVGEVVLADFLKDEEQVGSAVIFMPPSIRFIEDNVTKILMRQTGLMISRQRSEEEVQRLLHENETIFNGTQGSLFLVQVLGKGRFRYLKNNMAYYRNTGKNVAGKTPEEAFGRELGKRFCERFSRCIREARPITFQDTIRTEDDEKALIVTLTPIFYESGPTYIVGFFENITERKRAEKEAKKSFQEIRYLSYHDPLTGLYNHRYFDELLNGAGMPQIHPVTVVMADVNGLKLMNDAFGHAAGDELLKAAAKLLLSVARKGDAVIRLGGDEFVLLLNNTSSDQAGLLIRELGRLCEQTFVGAVKLSISFGYDTTRGAEDAIEAALKKAEDNMYRRKLIDSPSVKEETIDLILCKLFETNKSEKSHLEKVAELSENLGRLLSMDEKELRELYTAGMLHDIGKIAVDGRILNKRGALTEEEWLEVTRHSETGYRIVSSVNSYSAVSEYVLAHHERWDGGGYPKGLTGEKIPLQARIITIADAFEAMTGYRTYRVSKSKAEAVRELKLNAGSQFDPELTRIFIEEVLNEPW